MKQITCSICFIRKLIFWKQITCRICFRKRLIFLETNWDHHLTITWMKNQFWILNIFLPCKEKAWPLSLCFNRSILTSAFGKGIYILFTWFMKQCHKKMHISNACNIFSLVDFYQPNEELMFQPNKSFCLF